ncbi:MAG TPA: hypothetical protein QF621_04510 [Candidatus Thalassarchaeaceae archaeon]|nr:hypothetical protein [Candidatus Thalassarchaeaceae archaeon]
MSRKTIVWSPSRIRTLNECPRRYVHFHVVGNGGWPGGPRAQDENVARAWHLGSKRKHSDLMLRATADGVKDWILMKYRGEKWTEKSAKNEMNARMRCKLKENCGDIDDVLVKKMMVDGFPRLSALERAPLISQLGSERVEEWMPLNRLEPHWVGNSRVYTVPDLIAKIGDKWHLVRLTTQMWRRVPSEIQQLELGVMLKWALEEPSLPNSAEQFVIHRIGWVHHRWLGWRKIGSAVWNDASQIMLAHDLKELRFMHLTNREDSILDNLATDDSKQHCSNCGYRKECPQNNHN